MKNPSDKLFKLIHSMSANEKNYFKRQTAAHNRKSDNQYLDVFDAIAKQEEYDEAALLKKFKNRDFVKQFAAMKRYLYKVLMQTLIDLYEQKDIVSEIHKMRSEARVLIDRGLEKEGLLIYKKAREKAAYWDLPTLQLSLLLEENKHIVGAQDNNKSKIESFHHELKRLTDLLSNLSDYTQLYDTFIYWEKRERHLRDENALASLEEIIQSPKIQQLDENTAFMSKLQYYAIHERYAMIKGDDALLLQCKKQIFQLYDHNPHIKEVDEKNYFIVSLNYLNTLYRIGDYHTLKEKLVLFEKNTFKDTETQRLFYSRLLLLKLAYCEISGDFKDFDKTVKTIEKDFSNPDYEISPIEWRLKFYNFVKLYIIKGDYQKAQTWVIELLNLPKTEQQSDLQRFAELLQILIHYQLGDEMLLDYLNTTVKRRMSQQNKLYPYEKLFLDLFNKLTHALPNKRNGILQKYLVKCRALFEEESKFHTSKVYFDLPYWIEATLENKTMLYLIQQQRMLSQQNK